MSRHVRQPSNGGITGPIRFAAKENPLKTTATRQALSEVTTAAVNRKVCYCWSSLASMLMNVQQETGVKPSTGKEKEEIGLKRGRSDSTTLAQRVPLGPGRGQPAPNVITNATARIPPSRTRLPAPPKRISVRAAIADQINDEIEVQAEIVQSEMEVEEDVVDDCDDDVLLVNEQEVEAMIGVQDSESEGEEEEVQFEKPPRIWPEVSTDRALRYQKEVQSIRERFEDEVDMYDTTMVSEYAEEIFEYMCDLEVHLIWFLSL